MIKNNTSHWKEKAKKIFQLYIRLRDANKSGICRCCTCGKYMHYKECDAGHFIRAINMTVCFDERNVHAQCKGCNKYQNGAWEKYLMFMKIQYGQQVIDELNMFRGYAVKRTVSDYMGIYNRYKLKSEQLKAEKGL